MATEEKKEAKEFEVKQGQNSNIFWGKFREKLSNFSFTWKPPNFPDFLYQKSRGTRDFYFE
jgi:hypothetical protein